MSYLQVKNVVKSFGNNKVLENISIDFEKGEIHSIIGCLLYTSDAADE